MSRIYENDGTRIILAEGRASYVFLTPGEPYVDNNGREKYKLTLAMPKASFKEQKKFIIAAVVQAIEQGAAKGHFTKAMAKTAIGGLTKKGKNVPPSFLLPFSDADEKMDLGDWQEQEALRGTICFTPWNKKRPAIVDKNKIPIDDNDEIYSGMWCLCHVSFFPFGKDRPKSGIGCYLNAVLKTKDDEPLDGSVSAETAFKAVEVADEETAEEDLE